jgi:hypothetical protein
MTCMAYGAFGSNILVYSNRVSIWKPERFFEIGLYFEVSDDQRREYFGLEAFIATLLPAAFV